MVQIVDFKQAKEQRERGQPTKREDQTAKGPGCWSHRGLETGSPRQQGNINAAATSVLYPCGHHGEQHHLAFASFCL